MKPPIRVPNRAIVPRGDYFLRLDPVDPGFHWSLWRRHPTDLKADVIVVNWSGEIPGADTADVGDPRYPDAAQMERDNHFVAYEIDQDWAAGLEMASRHGRTGNAWFALIEREIEWESLMAKPLLKK